MKAHERMTACAIVIATLSGAMGSAWAADETPPAPPPDDRWTSYVGLGAQFLPDYDENGRGSGLNKQELFALVTADGRFGNDCGDRDEKGKLRETEQNKKKSFQVCLNPLMGPWHTGVTLTLLGTPVQREDKPAISPTEFNDVARTAVMAGYLYLPMIQSNDTVDNFGPLVRASAISRENLDTNDDSVTWTYGLGVQYTSEHYRTDPDPTKNHWNAAPRGYVRLYAARYEDYAGFGKATRFVTDAALRVYPKMDLYFGFQGNFGNGPDEMAVVVSFVRTPEEIAKLFNLGK
jgi:hypothetical protein